jgi:hypothetical protein
MGGKGSGRKEYGAVRDVTITKRITRTTEQRDPTAAKLYEVLAEQERFGVDAWFRTVFNVVGVDEVWIHKLLPDASEPKVGFISRAVAETEEDLELVLLNKYRPGKFLLKPVKRGVWVGPQKRFQLGAANVSDAGLYEGSIEDSERRIAAIQRREDVLNATLQLKRMNDAMAGKGGEDPLKAEDFKVIAEALATARGANGGASEAVMLRMVERLDGLEKRLSEPAWNQLITSLTPLLMPLLAALKPGTLEKYAGLLKGFMGTTVAAAPERPWWEGIAALVKEALASPALQPLIVKLIEMQPTRPALVPVPPAALSAKTEEGEFTDPDTREALDSVVGYLGERKFAEAWTVMRQMPDLAPWVAQVEPDVAPMAYWFGLKALDKRFPEMKATALEFIEFIQTRIAEFIKAAEAAEAEAAGNGDKDAAGKT